MAATIDAALNAAIQITGLCDNLRRIARGEQPRNEWGKTDEELQDHARRLCDLVYQSCDTPLSLIGEADDLLPHCVPPIEVGGAYGGSYHRAVAKLAVEIRAELIKARISGSLGVADAGFADWWPLAAAALAERPKFVFTQVVESLRCEAINAENAPADRPKDEQLAEQPAVPPKVNYSPDFRSVHWYGEPYRFTATQAACVKLLFENWKQATPVLGEQTILEAADSNGSRLRDVFDKGKHPAWGTMIVPAGKGAFRLQEPQENSGPEQNPT